MRLTFQVGSSTVTYRRSPWTGLDSLTVDGEAHRLSKLLEANKPTFELDRETLAGVNGTPVTIRARRPLWFGGLRPHHYTVLVDGDVVMTRNGY
jgi:hypothetical protein